MTGRRDALTRPSGTVCPAGGWSAELTVSGDTWTFTDALWNAALASGASTAIGLNGAHSGAGSLPIAFAPNGAPCATG